MREESQSWNEGGVKVYTKHWYGLTFGKHPSRTDHTEGELRIISSFLPIVTSDSISSHSLSSSLNPPFLVYFTNKNRRVSLRFKFLPNTPCRPTLLPTDSRRGPLLQPYYVTTTVSDLGGEVASFIYGSVSLGGFWNGWEVYHVFDLGGSIRSQVSPFPFRLSLWLPGWSWVEGLRTLSYPYRKVVG